MPVNTTPHTAAAAAKTGGLVCNLATPDATTSHCLGKAAACQAPLQMLAPRSALIAKEYVHARKKAVMLVDHHLMCDY